MHIILSYRPDCNVVQCDFFEKDSLIFSISGRKQSIYYTFCIEIVIQERQCVRLLLVGCSQACPVTSMQGHSRTNLEWKSIEFKWKKNLFILYYMNFQMNKNILTGPANCKKATRYHADTSLCAKYRKTNYAKLRKCRKTSIWAIFWRILRPNISKLQIFLKNRFHSNWKSYLVLTSSEKPKKSWGVFEKSIKVSDFWLIWILFREYLQIKNFFQKSGCD